jgi:hypothetical protein
MNKYLVKTNNGKIEIVADKLVESHGTLNFLTVSNSKSELVYSIAAGRWNTVEKIETNQPTNTKTLAA